MLLKMALFHYFLRLSTIPLDACIFIHSPVDRHLGCFHVLAIVNSNAMTIGVHVSFQIMVFSGYMPKSGIAGSYGISIFKFLKETSILFSKQFLKHVHEDLCSTMSK